MKYACLLVSAVVTISGLLFAQDPPTTAPASADRSLLEAKAATILAASSPSEAVAAFAAADRIAPNDPIILGAYVRRMVELAEPQLAVDQAQILVKADPKAGLAWSVLAYNAAARSDYRTALSSIRVAAEYLPADPFVVKTAGQILGWYDSNYKFADLPQPYRIVISQLNQKLTNKVDFIEAYRTTVRENACAKVTAMPTTQRNQLVYGPAYQKPSPEVAAQSNQIIAARTVQPIYPSVTIQQLAPQYVQPPVSSGAFPPLYPLGVNRDFLFPGTSSRLIVVPGG